MTTDHPITPPSKLAEKWYQEAPDDDEIGLAQHIATQAAHWGADQELGACCEWVGAISGKYGPRLRTARRPKPPSLKEQSLALIDKIQASKESWDISELNVVRRALEALDD
jgi:hypothetical protein